MDQGIFEDNLDLSGNPVDVSETELSKSILVKEIDDNTNIMLSLEQKLKELRNFRDDLLNGQGVDTGISAAIEHITENRLSKKVNLRSFTKRLSKVNYKETLEALEEEILFSGKSFLNSFIEVLKNFNTHFNTDLGSIRYSLPAIPDESSISEETKGFLIDNLGSLVNSYTAKVILEGKDNGDFSSLLKSYILETASLKTQIMRLEDILSKWSVGTGYSLDNNDLVQFTKSPNILGAETGTLTNAANALYSYIQMKIDAEPLGKSLLTELTLPLSKEVFLRTEEVIKTKTERFGSFDSVIRDCTNNIFKIANDEEIQLNELTPEIITAIRCVTDRISVVYFLGKAISRSVLRVGRVVSVYNHILTASR